MAFDVPKRPRSNWSPHPDDVAGRKSERARAGQFSCAPRDPACDGCLFPRQMGYNERLTGYPKWQEMPCGYCKYCREQRLRAETSLVMSEVATSDWSLMMTLTVADPASVDVLQAEAEADASDDLLPSALREWRALNRDARLARAYDLGHIWLNPPLVRAFKKRVNAQGRKQGSLAVNRYRRGLRDEYVEKRLEGLFPEAGEGERQWVARVLAEEKLARREWKAALKHELPEAKAARLAAEAEVRAREGFSVLVWTVGQYGGETMRPHWHLLVCGRGKVPSTWPRSGYRSVEEFLRLRQWPHGHMQLDWDLTEAGVRYAVRYLLDGIGLPRGVTWETPHSSAIDFAGKRQKRSFVGGANTKQSSYSPLRALFWNKKKQRHEPRGYVARPRKGGHEFARRMGREWAKAGLFPSDFRAIVPEMRDQRREYRRDGSLKHSGRASMFSGSRRMVALETFRLALGLTPLQVQAYAEKRDVWAQQSCDKFTRWHAEREARRDKLAEAERDLGRVMREQDFSRRSEAMARALAWDERDEWDIQDASHVAALRELSGARIRAALDRKVSAPISLGPLIVPGPERDAYEAALALAQSGDLVWQDGAWCDLRDGPAARAARAPP